MAEMKQPVTAVIADAFMELMTEKPFNDITVTDVVRKAGVARASFYRNFASTSDILDMVLSDLLRQFSEEALPVIISQDERGLRAFLFRYIHFISDHHQKLILSRSANVSILLFRMADAIHELSQQHTFGSVHEKYCIASRISVINGVIARWIDDGRRETPEEIVDYLMGFILKI